MIFRLVQQFQEQSGMFNPVTFIGESGERRAMSYYDLAIHRYRRLNETGYEDDFKVVLLPRQKGLAVSMYQALIGMPWNGRLIVTEDNCWYDKHGLVVWLERCKPYPLQTTLINGRLRRLRHVNLNANTDDIYLEKWERWFSELEVLFENHDGSSLADGKD